MYNVGLFSIAALVSIAVNPLLSAHQLTCERGGLTLFAKLDLTVIPGRLIQIIGPNGCGKTTLLRLLAGLSLPTEGRIIRHEESCLFLGHRPAIKSQLSAIENLQWYFPQKTLPEIKEALAAWQLDGYEYLRCGQLSAGQQQRVALSRLLLTDSRLWLLDEPFTAIDRHGIKQLEQCLLQQTQKGGSVLFTSHHEFSVREFLHELILQQYSSGIFSEAG